MRGRNTNLWLFLVAIIALQFGAPITYYGTFATALYLSCYVAMVIFGVLAVRVRDWHIPIHTILAITSFVVVGVYVLNFDSRLALLAVAVTLGLFLISLFIALLEYLLLSPDERDTQALLLTSVCGYLLIGSIFTTFFTVFELSVPGSFIDSASPEGPVTWQQLVYFSYVSLTTLGYGDVLPVVPWSRSLATLESALGTLYIAVVIARLVGIYSSERSS